MVVVVVVVVVVAAPTCCYYYYYYHYYYHSPLLLSIPLSPRLLSLSRSHSRIIIIITTFIIFLY